MAQTSLLDLQQAVKVRKRQLEQMLKGVTNLDTDQSVSPTIEDDLEALAEEWVDLNETLKALEWKAPASLARILSRYFRDLSRRTLEMRGRIDKMLRNEE
ncbi:MAG TPA: hypothetical protein VKU00_29445 [Chthonomonadaceae bacterium]|nr:hypothetical protein [Chthonomonadaceae bacterium]